MLGIVRLYHDSYGNNMGSRTFCKLSEYFGGVLITNNKKIIELGKYKTISHEDALRNVKKFTKLMIYNSKPNMFGGVAPKHIHDVVRLINSVKDLYFYNCDPILDLQRSVPRSHENTVPGLTGAIGLLVNHCTHLSRKNTDLTKFLAASIDKQPIKIGTVEKEWTAAYFGNARQPKRQKQIYDLLYPLEQRLIIGHESEHFAWLNYTPDFYELLSSAWVTPIIGDDKLHYETGIPSLRLYETWHTTTVGLIDSRLKEPLLDERFYFSSPEEFHQKAKLISEDKELYSSMIKKQQKALKVLKRKFKNARFNWGKVRKGKEQKSKEFKKQRAEDKKQRLLKVQNRLKINKQHLQN